MAIDSGTSALIVAGLTLTGLVIDKIVTRINSRETAGVTGVTAKASAAQTEAKVQIDWMHEANSLQQDLLKVRRETNEEIDRLTSRLRSLQEAHDRKDGLLNDCLVEKATAVTRSAKAIKGWDLWRLTARAAWTHIDYLERGKVEPQYQRIAQTYYLEATEYDKAERFDDETRRTVFEEAGQPDTTSEITA